MAEIADLKRKWSLEDLVDFEAPLHDSVEEGSAAERWWEHCEGPPCSWEGWHYFCGTALTGPTEIPPSTRIV